MLGEEYSVEGWMHGGVLERGDGKEEAHTDS